MIRKAGNGSQSRRHCRHIVAIDPAMSASSGIASTGHDGARLRVNTGVK
jgi:hypothetical protein